MTGRINVYLVCGGKWHDFDFARLELLKLLAEHERARVRVADDFEDLDAIAASDVLVAYTCDVRPSAAAQSAVRGWVESGRRFLALHGTNSALDLPSSLGQGSVEAPRVFPDWVDMLGSQFIAHPPLMSYRVTVSPGAEDDPLVRGLTEFDSGEDELYLCEYYGNLEPLLETRWTGTTRGFAEPDWPTDEPRLVMYRRPLGDGCVLYLTLGHCRSHYDMDSAPIHVAYYPVIERGSWEIPEYYELVRRALRWAIEPVAGSTDTEETP
jgi:hypothetical protein